MKIIEPSFEIININGDLKTIEQAARTCYKSEDKIKDGSAERLVSTLVDRGHHAMLEFVDVTVKFITDRGIANEIVRHRIASYAQESTRYVSSSSKLDIGDYNFYEESDVCRSYEDGNSMRIISENSQFTEWEVRKILKRNNIEIRGLNNKGNRNEDFFKRIDSPEKAYLLGLIQTDGSIRRNGSSFTITQHKDYYWYIDILCHMFSDYVSVCDDKNCKNITIGNKNIVEDLISLGIVPNKTYEQTNDDIERLWESIPSKFKNSFIRGLIDGDGWVKYFIQPRGVNKSCNIGFCSINERIVDIIIETIYEMFGYKCGKHIQNDIYRLTITDYKKSIDIGKWLYSDFSYPLGHPSKSSAWISEIGDEYLFADYGSDKFSVILPEWVEKSSPETKYIFSKSLWISENAYSEMRNIGATPQDARAILPLCLKTELVMKTNLRSWRNFFELRTSPAAHPEIRRIAIPLCKELQKRIPVVFDDFVFGD